ncbi:MAG: hypothetical protein HZA54_19920 [Planctomycetes bacterium]|nr:hypothetical protein [Planctomycetota bacterium]
MDTDALDVMLSVVEVLDRLGIRYSVGGSIASSAYGELRSTHDADLLVELRAEGVRPLVEALRSDFYIDEDTVRDAVARRSSFNVIHLKWLLKADLFVAGDRPLDRAQLARRRLEIVSVDPERKAYLVSPEDIVLVKLDGYRKGGGISDCQWRDVLGVLKARCHDLDRAYLERTAAEAGLSDLLARAQREAGLPHAGP